MRIVLYFDDELKTKKKRKQKKGGFAIVSVLLAILLIAACALVTAAHWTDIAALFQKEEVHVHTWQSVTLENATCTEDGVLLRVCDTCGEEEKSFLPAFGHSLADNVCAECGKEASSGLAYTFETEGRTSFAVITGMGECTDRDVVIPNKIGGMPVKKIAANAFAGNTQIYTLSFGEEVEIISI